MAEHSLRQRVWLPRSDSNREGWYRATLVQGYTVVDAMTKEGPLGVALSVCNSLKMEDDCASSLLVFAAKARDYHKSWTANQFISWVKHRLVPAFTAKYPDKKMVLLMDNASTHKLRMPGFVNPTAWTKTKMCEWLTAHHIAAVTIGTEEIAVGSIGWGHPKREDLAAFITDVAKRANPDAWKNFKVDLVLNECIPGSKAIFLPPYACVFNPIEKLWRAMKERMRQDYKDERTQDDVTNAVISNTRPSEHYVAPNYAKYVDDMLSYAKAVVRNDAGLDGELGEGVRVSIVAEHSEEAAEVVLVQHCWTRGCPSFRLVKLKTTSTMMKVGICALMIQKQKTD